MRQQLQDSMDTSEEFLQQTNNEIQWKSLVKPSANNQTVQQFTSESHGSQTTILRNNHQSLLDETNSYKGRSFDDSITTEEQRKRSKKQQSSKISPNHNKRTQSLGVVYEEDSRNYYSTHQNLKE
ncbi:UNKNOWN [Stylonychia lemnae]|uniref:Uncharacterized protein n=1 Tax=Stylonychia lemnae TaxID=5949 RepID=A0A078A8U1_STYLE|nr:UNKNOWN [Stylonychia lemnae]|eukprot:CDW77218.1 UNKNOWN [Stylonychia lemnae]